MRSQQQYIDEYQVSHQNGVNQIIHMICVPAIFFASLAFGWMAPVGSWMGVPSAWLNLATLSAIPILLFYGRLGRASFVTGLAWVAVSLALCASIQAMGLPLLWIAIVTFVVAWIVQFVGHKIEGAKPSFFKDLFFLLIGPLFVQQKFDQMLRGR